MKTLGTIARGIKTPIIQRGDNLAEVVVSSLMKASEEGKFQINDQDVVAITEAVVGISSHNYATLEDISMDIKEKYPNDHLGIVFPILSRNRFSLLLKAFSKAFKEITLLLSYPSDEVGNDILDRELLKKMAINKYSDQISERSYYEYFGTFKHPFTGINMVDYYKHLIQESGAKARIVLSNQAKDIFQYTKQVLVCDIHTRFETYKQLIDEKDALVYRLDQLMNHSINGSGYNKKYGLLGSNIANDHTVKLFPNDSMLLLLEIQKRMYELTKKRVEVMIYGDGAFKDPSSGIWELADPVVSPSYTKGLEGGPNEVKLKMIVDEEVMDKHTLTEKIKKTIESKEKNLVGTHISLGTTPRRYVDLIGSLCDLVSGSGDKGTPVVLVQNYFTNYTT